MNNTCKYQLMNFVNRTSAFSSFNFGGFISLAGVRFASKKTGGSTRYQKIDQRPKHRGWRVQDGHRVTPGTILAAQLHLRFHPGLNVGFGRNGNLFAMEHGRVMVTCEKINPDWDHTWIKRIYGGRENQTIYKKHFNVIPDPQHNRFILKDRI